VFLRRFVLCIVLIALVLSGSVSPTASAAGRTRPQRPTSITRSAATTPPAVTPAIALALTYLETQQDADGGVAGFTPGSSDIFTTAKTVMALASDGLPVSFLTKSGKTPLDYLASQAVAYTHQQSGPPLLFPGRAGILAVAVVSGDGNPRAFGTPTAMDLIGELEATYNPANGTYSTAASEGFSTGGPDAVNQLWAILGLAAAQKTVPGPATAYLASLQDPGDGGWGYGFGSDIDLTALVLQSLLASGNLAPDDPIIQHGVTFLRSTQVTTGGWAPYGTLSADSTAGAIQAVVADGYLPPTASWATATGRTPLDELLGLQAPDGSFSGNALGTAHAILGLAQVALPIFGRVQRANLALSWIHSQQNADGSWASGFGSNVGSTCDAVLAFATDGFDPATLKATGGTATAMDYLAANGATYAVGTSPDQAGKLTLAVKAAGMDPTSFGGINLIDAIDSYYSSTNQAYGDKTNTWQQSLAILGLAADSQTIHAEAVTTLEGLQQTDGGWKYDLTPGDWNVSAPDNTGLALQALIAAGVPATDSHIVNGKNFLRAKQDAAAGWSDANDTAYAMQGLLAAGEDLAANWSVGGHTPFNALASYQKSDGPFVFSWDLAQGQPVDNALATGQAVPALLGAHYPFTPGAQLNPFADVARGPNPDRLVTAAPQLKLSGRAIAVTVPFGSDVDANGLLNLSYQINGGTAQPLGDVRATGSFTATIPKPTSGVYTVKSDFSDPDGVQGLVSQTTTVTVTQAYLPSVDQAVTP
jgi:hypothetical protein